MSRFLPASPAELRADGHDRADVLLVSGDAYVDHPSFGAAVETEFILAMGKVQDKVITLLDIDKVLTADEIAAAAAAGKGQSPK